MPGFHVAWPSMKTTMARSPSASHLGNQIPYARKDSITPESLEMRPSRVELGVYKLDDTF